MKLRAALTVLGSGSSGNASLLQVEDAGLLLDVGLGPRQIATRSATVGVSWDCIHAAVLTHTHADHWKDLTFTQLLKREVPLHCHKGHAISLRRRSAVFPQLEAAGLVHSYRANEPFGLLDGLRVRAVPVSHDGGATFGFRIEKERDLFGRGWSLAYTADLGTWDADLIPWLADVDVLALEFNHDVAMQRASGRPAHLIDRVLGDRGHLSNAQAADLLHATIEASPSGRLRHVVQLHLSRQCNRPSLAAEAATAVLSRRGIAAQVHTAHQYQPLQILVQD